MFEIILIIIGSILIITGLIGCIIPALPGPPLSFVSLILLQFASNPPFSTPFILIWAIIVGVVTLLDYMVPIWGTKKFGGSKWGSWGSLIGLVFGLFLGPLGIVLGPFLGALFGELISGMSSRLALKAAFGSFIGFLAGTVMKLGVVVVLGYYFVKASVELL